MDIINSILDKLIEWSYKFFKFFGIEGIIYILLSALLVSILDIFIPLWLAIVVTVILCLGKEFYYDEYLGKGEFSTRDLLAYLIGILLGCL